MQPSQFEIQREVEALRDIRRRSTAQGGPGSLILDPDLPSPSSPSSSSASYWPPTQDDSSSSSHEDSNENDSTTSSDDPSHLFWVPARLHPEIAPAEFRAFLKEHARAPSADGVTRSNSVSSLALGRKKSMLSRQYNPSVTDHVEEETVVPIRKRTSVFTNPGPQLTISDLQKLEELAEEASRSDDPTRLRAVLRRSLSLNIAPSVIDQMDDIPDILDDADSPIIVPRPGQVLRRAARTKIRKAGQTTEGAHRFTAKRARRASGGRPAALEPRTSSDRSSSDHGEGDRNRLEPDIPEVPLVPQRNSYSEESSIYDAYAREEPDDMEAPVVVTAADYSSEYSQIVAASPPIPQQPEPAVELPYAPPVPVISPTPIRQPQPQRLLSAPQTSTPANLRTPSPESSSPSVSPEASPQSNSIRPPLQEAPMYQPPPSPSPSEIQRRDKDKKSGLFGKWGSDKNGKRTSKEKEKESFFGSIFGRKKQEDQAPPMGGIGSGGREMAANILGPSKSSKNYVPPPSPTPAGGYARYPIHVERAIYRLSHIKLANPRRPLYEQVLISNLMFWYLGVINKNQNGNTQSSTNPAANGSSEKEQAEREKKEREEREKAEKERLEKERGGEKVEQKREPRRGSLTKAPSPGTPGARRAEQMAVRDPQYGVQHRAMEQEYAFNQPGNGQAGRGGSMPPGAPGYQGNRGMGGPPPSQYSQSVQLVQPQPQPGGQNRYYNGSGVGNPPMQNQQYGMGPGASQLPPGAMPPVNVEQGGWLNNPPPGMVPMARGGPSPPQPQQRNVSPPSQLQGQSARRARSPPPPGPGRYASGQEKQGRLPGRSQSATAAPPVPPVPQVNGKLRKGQSAHAVLPHQRITSEEEDVPLAVYQQQRRK